MASSDKFITKKVKVFKSVLNIIACSVDRNLRVNFCRIIFKIKI